MKLAMVFPGQGSQAVGMLRAYAGLPEIDAVRDAVAAVLGAGFVRMLDEGPAEALGLTVNTQPAMVAAGVAAYRAWRALGGPLPEVVAGHSLGEYAALVAADAIAFEACLPLVRRRGEAMQSAVPAGQGAMAAILSLDDAGVVAACAESEQGEVVQAVNFNAPGQVVIAGDKDAVGRAMNACKARGARRVLPLPVSAPFHSRLMQPAAQALQTYLENVVFRVPAIPVINNVDVCIETEPERIKGALVRQAAAPVRWVEIISRLAAMGITHVIECGPGKVLAGLTKRIDANLHSYALVDRESLEQALAAVRTA